MSAYFLFDTHNFGVVLVIGKTSSSRYLFCLMWILSWKLWYISFWIILQALCIWIQCTLKRHQKVDEASRKCGLYQNIIIIYCFCHCPYHILQSFAVLRRKNKWSNTDHIWFLYMPPRKLLILYMPSMCLTSGTPIVTWQWHMTEGFKFLPRGLWRLFFSNSFGKSTAQTLCTDIH